MLPVVEVPRAPIAVGARVVEHGRTSRAARKPRTVTALSETTAFLDDGTEHPLSHLVVISDTPTRLVTTGTVLGPGPDHRVIEGENLHALHLLAPDLDGTADVVFLDPPYNTGGKNIGTYADSRTGWLDFMAERLRAARDLLKPSGVVMVCIGETEHHRLRVLLDDIFGADNFAANLIWLGDGSALSDFTSGGVDYIVVYARDRAAHTAAVGPWGEAKAEAERVLAAAADAWAATGDADAATVAMKVWWSTQPDLGPGLAHYRRIDERGRLFTPDNLGGNNGLHYDVTHPVTGEPVKRPKPGWRTTETGMAAWIAEGRVLFGSDHTTIPRFKRFLDEHLTQLPDPWFVRSRTHASRHLENLLGDRRFPFPKDHEVLMRWLAMACPPDGLVVDYFGGSGSTTEAVIRLNARDGGTRRSILVTSNEVAARDAKTMTAAGLDPRDDAWSAAGVFSTVTRPRLSTLVTGTRPDGSVYDDPCRAHVVFERVDYTTVAEPDARAA